MSAFISKRLSLLLLLCAYLGSLLIVLLLNYALAGPKLGAVYDVFLGFRPSPPVSRDILLIETDEVIEPGDVFSVLMTLSEMGASDLLVEVSVLGSESGGIEDGTEFIHQINDEFSLMGRNIRNLFEAIRLGLVSPVESPAYVNSLVELAERGRERLASTIVRQDGAGSVRAAQAAEVFGKAMAAEDLRRQPLDGVPWYSRPSLDPDRVLRRIAPVAEGVAHIAYVALMPRWTESLIEYTEEGRVLINRFEVQGEEAEHRFFLDRDGNLILEKPGKDDDFRRLSLELFREYDRADRAMARLLKDAEAIGVYSETIPDQIPLFLADYADGLKEQLLADPDEDKRAAWIRARSRYIDSLDEFLYGPSEMTLVNGYEKLIAQEEHGEGGIAKLQALRDELIRAFIGMREKHRELVDLRVALVREIAASFCIMGPRLIAAAPSAAGWSAVPESSALLANALLNGRSITPGQTRHIVFWSLAASLAVLFCIHALEPLALLLTGLAASVACGIAFVAAFVASAYWIDPLIPMAACLGGVLVLAVSRFCIGYGRALRFTLAYSASVNRDTLKSLVKKGRPLLSETVCANAAIIAVKNHRLPAREDREGPIEAANIVREFRETFSRYFKQAGAQILAFEGDTALACFGSPLEQAKHGTNHSLRAVKCVTELLGNSLFDDCRFGLESGVCAFSWSGETGYVANGQAAVRARIFAALAARYRARAIIGEAAREAAGLRARKLSALGNSTDGLGGDNFYELKKSGTLP
ncbi:MAG: hypothetical protein LBQ69_04890 [Treponema sp.]|jgi:hypothetical protein|nr:hypothetical protein [Treponema sp.]